MTESPKIEYLPDASIDDKLDAELRGLLTTCFRKPEDVIFETQRYFKEPYPHRWVIRDDEGALVAHVGVHVKKVEAEGVEYPIGGICEVCVHPDYRGRGYVRAMLVRIHEWMPGQNFVFSMLFGHPSIYCSSGYREIPNLFNGGADGWQNVKSMILELTDTPWPDGEVHLPGPKF
jgi:predicted acetyltransferase